MAEDAKATKNCPPHCSHPNAHSLTIIATIGFLLLGSVIFNLFMVFRPQHPDFFVTGATLSFLNSSGDQPTADCDVKITVFNGNKKLGVKYENVRAAIGYEDEPLASTSIPSFYQEKQNTTTIPVHLVIHFANTSNSCELKSGARSEGKVYLNVQLWTSVQFNVDPWRIGWQALKVDCHNVVIDWPPPSGGYPLFGTLNSVRRCATHCY
ncbi:hypothetical protein EJ110_NYTH13962 [Nymphaea thermarum]|nr:hypothetical protein EJ110_NYTH13962 [Nymphaea thermarum]